MKKITTPLICRNCSREVRPRKRFDECSFCHTSFVIKEKKPIENHELKKILKNPKIFSYLVYTIKYNPKTNSHFAIASCDSINTSTRWVKYLVKKDLINKSKGVGYAINKEKFLLYYIKFLDKENEFLKLGKKCKPLISNILVQILKHKKVIKKYRSEYEALHKNIEFVDKMNETDMMFSSKLSHMNFNATNLEEYFSYFSIIIHTELIDILIHFNRKIKKNKKILIELTEFLTALKVKKIGTGSILTERLYQYFGIR